MLKTLSTLARLGLIPRPSRGCRDRNAPECIAQACNRPNSSSAVTRPAGCWASGGSKAPREKRLERSASREAPREKRLERHASRDAPREKRLERNASREAPREKRLERSASRGAPREKRLERSASREAPPSGAA
eukprot:350426-Chlamydomonas_euryale.AAC.6